MMDDRYLEIGDKVVVTDASDPDLIDKVGILIEKNSGYYCVMLGEQWAWDIVLNVKKFIPPLSSKMSEKGDRQNSANKFKKLPLAELHPEFLRQLATVHRVGKEKGYTKFSWTDLEMFPTQEILNAAMRHINAHLSGNLYNPEEGCKTVGTHLAHAAYDLLIAATQISLQQEQDNEK